MIRHDLEDMFKKRIPITVLTDSDSLFRIIIKDSVTTEKLLMIDMKAARGDYHKQDFRAVRWIFSTQNLANGLTKFDKRRPLVDCLEEGMLTTCIELWVISSEVAGSDKHVEEDNLAAGIDDKRDVVATSYSVYRDVLATGDVEGRISMTVGDSDEWNSLAAAGADDRESLAAGDPEEDGLVLVFNERENR